jgi:hypothetical protein
MIGFFSTLNFRNRFPPRKNRALNFPRHELILPEQYSCTSRYGFTKLFIKTDIILFEHFVLPVVSACTSYSQRLYFSESRLALLADDWTFFVFRTFGFCQFSCTSYIKWVYCLCRMDVLLSFKYLNFLADDEIILFLYIWTLSVFSYFLQ